MTSTRSIYFVDHSMRTTTLSYPQLSTRMRRSTSAPRQVTISNLYSNPHFGRLEDPTAKDGPPEESSSVYEFHEKMKSRIAGRLEEFHVEHSSFVEWEKLWVRNALQAGKIGEGIFFYKFALSAPWDGMITA
jgi:hypothetical protein